MARCIASVQYSHLWAVLCAYLYNSNCTSIDDDDDAFAVFIAFPNWFWLPIQMDCSMAIIHIYLNMGHIRPLCVCVCVCAAIRRWSTLVAMRVRRTPRCLFTISYAYWMCKRPGRCGPTTYRQLIEDCLCALEFLPVSNMHSEFN